MQLHGYQFIALCDYQINCCDLIAYLYSLICWVFQSEASVWRCVHLHSSEQLVILCFQHLTAAQFTLNALKSISMHDVSCIW